MTCGDKPLWEIIQDLHPHVDEANAKRIADEALALPVPETVISKVHSNPRSRERARVVARVVARYVWVEAKKLKPE